MAAAHGFMFMNPDYSHDSLTSILRYPDTWQTSLGRFLHNPLKTIFGYVTSTWFIGLMSSLFFGAACFLICDYLQIKNLISILLISGVLASNPVLSNSVATYMPWVDAYSIAFFCAALAVWLMNRWKFGFLAGIPFIIICLGLYPPYIVCIPSLILIHLLLSMNGECNWKKRLLIIAKAAIMFILGYLFYRLILNAVLQAKHITMAEADNSMDRIKFTGFSNLPGLIQETYKAFFEYIGATFTDPYAGGAAKYLLLITTVIAAVYYIVKKSTTWPERICFLILLLISPIVFNVQKIVCENAAYHYLMVYSIFLAYVGLIGIYDRCIRTNDMAGEGLSGQKITPTAKSNGSDELPDPVPETLSNGKAYAKKADLFLHKYLLPVTIGLVLFCNMRYSNNLYTLKYMQERTTLSLMTRIMASAEQAEGYDPDYMSLVIIGSLSSNDMAKEIDSAYYPYILPKTYTLSVTYNLPQYLKYYMGYSRIGTSPEKMDLINKELERNPLPSYPHKGFARVIEDCLVVRLP